MKLPSGQTRVSFLLRRLGWWLLHRATLIERSRRCCTTASSSPWFELSGDRAARRAARIRELKS